MLLQWFAEQGDTVKVALISSIAAAFVGVGGGMAAWFKPVLRHPTTPGAATADPPGLESAIIDELAGIQVHLAEISRTLKDGDTGQKDQVRAILEKLDHVAEEVRDVKEEVRVVGERLR